MQVGWATARYANALIGRQHASRMGHGPLRILKIGLHAEKGGEVLVPCEQLYGPVPVNWRGNDLFFWRSTTQPC